MRAWRTHSIKFLSLRKEFQVIEPTTKRPKKRGKKSIFGEVQPAGTANNLSNISYSSFYGDEELADCKKPESPARYLGDEGDISLDYEYWPAHGDGPDTII